MNGKGEKHRVLELLRANGGSMKISKLKTKCGCHSLIDDMISDGTLVVDEQKHVREQVKV